MGAAASTSRKKAALAASKSVDEFSKNSLVMSLASTFQSFCEPGTDKIPASKIGEVYKALSGGDELKDTDAALTAMGVPKDGSVPWKVSTVTRWAYRSECRPVR